MSWFVEASAMDYRIDSRTASMSFVSKVFLGISLEGLDGVCIIWSVGVAGEITAIGIQ